MIAQVARILARWQMPAPAQILQEISSAFVSLLYLKSSHGELAEQVTSVPKRL
jgi:hypothetical protein